MKTHQKLLMLLAGIGILTSTTKKTFSQNSETLNDTAYTAFTEADIIFNKALNEDKIFAGISNVASADPLTLETSAIFGYNHALQEFSSVDAHILFKYIGQNKNLQGLSGYADVRNVKRNTESNDTEIILGIKYSKELKKGEVGIILAYALEEGIRYGGTANFRISDFIISIHPEFKMHPKFNLSYLKGGINYFPGLSKNKNAGRPYRGPYIGMGVLSEPEYFDSPLNLNIVGFAGYKFNNLPRKNLTGQKNNKN